MEGMGDLFLIQVQPLAPNQKSPTKIRIWNVKSFELPLEEGERWFFQRGEGGVKETGVDLPVDRTPQGEG